MNNPTPLPSHIGAYEILGPLGQGGMSQIYLARDTRLGREVALKLLNDALTQDAEAIERFAQEARAASALNHPNIVTIYEVGGVEGRRFIAMELVRGKTLRMLFTEQPRALDRFSDVAVQIARALGAAHAALLVHRDIKPENIMVREDGYVKLVDFGIARLLRAPLDDVTMAATIAATAEGMIIGTPRYMSPEQVRGETLTSASDIFSFGVVAYEWVTGRHPFPGEAAVDVLHAITSASVLAPSKFNPEVTPAIDALILEMLDKNPMRRPSSVEIAEELAQAGITRAGVGPAARIAVKPVTVGREGERRELRAAFDEVARGRGLLLSVSGEPGVGKTTLIEDVLGELTADAVACYVARGRCSERLAGTEAYLPFLEALDSLLQAEGRETVARILKTLAPTWYLQLSVAVDSTTPAPETRAGSQERLKRELLTALEELSRLRPLVLFFDDVHWADASTVDLLAYLAGRFERLRVLVIATYRPTELQVAGHPFLAVKLELEGRGLARERPLHLLSREDVDAYVARTFPNHQLPPALLSMVYDKTEGNPLFMVDLLRDLRDRDVIVNIGDSWQLADAVQILGRDVPESIRSLIQRKIDALPEEDRRVLVTASVQGVRFDTAVIARALDTDPGDLEERLDRLERVHALVRLVGEQPLPDGAPSSQYRFVHALYQNGLYGSLRPVRRAALSGAIAATLESCHARDTTPIAAELAFLFETARNFERAARCFLQAAQKAIGVFAYHEAITLSRRSLEMLHDVPETPARAQVELDVQIGLGLSLLLTKGYAAPEVEEAMIRARALCAEVDDQRRLFRVVETMWGIYFARADFVKASDLAHQLMTLAVAAGDDRLLAVAHQNVGYPLTQYGRHREALTHLDQGLALERPDRSPPQTAGTARVDPTVRSLMWSSKSLFLLGYPEQAKSRLDRAVARANELGYPYTQAIVHAIAGWACHQRRDPHAVQGHAEAALAISIEHGLRQWVPMSHMMKGWALAEFGHAAEGIDSLLKGLDMYKATGAQIARPQFFSMLAEAYAKNEQYDKGRAAVDEALALAEKNRDVYWTPELYRLKGVLGLAAAQPETDAEACFRHAIEVARAQEARSLELRATVSLGRLWQRQGRPHDARAALIPILEWFTEGRDTIDQREARALLTELSGLEPT